MNTKGIRMLKDASVNMLLLNSKIYITLHTYVPLCRFKYNIFVLNTAVDIRIIIENNI